MAPSHRALPTFPRSKPGFGCGGVGNEGVGADAACYIAAIWESRPARKLASKSLDAGDAGSNGVLGVPAPWLGVGSEGAGFGNAESGTARLSHQFAISNPLISAAASARSNPAPDEPC